MNLYVGNLNYKVKEQDLEELFGEYGTVNSVKVISDKYSGRSKGFAFVEMENDKEAKKAIDELNGQVFQDRDMVVNEARPKKENY